MKLSPDAVRTLLTSVFPSDFIDDRARECGVVERDRDIDIRMLVWTLAVGFAVGGETRSIADYRRAYNAATNQSIAPSSFYDRFTENLHDLLSELLEPVVSRSYPYTSIGGVLVSRDNKPRSRVTQQDRRPESAG